jgi:hypothetical protein
MSFAFFCFLHWPQENGVAASRRCRVHLPRGSYCFVTVDGGADAEALVASVDMMSVG